MEWSRGRRALRAPSRTIGMAALVIGAALTLAACNPDNKPNVAAVEPHGATIAFESIDGPPRAQFDTLVQDLNTEAQAHRVAVIAREEPSAYRVRGYLAATVDDGKTTISWVWDVFDRQQQRALRISGSEIAKAGTGWRGADPAMLQRIASSSMTQFATFLTTPPVVPAVPGTGEPRIAFAMPDVSTPESAGIFRISKPQADPAASPAPASADAAASQPLPPHRPGNTVSSSETMTLAAARH